MSMIYEEISYVRTLLVADTKVLLSSPIKYSKTINSHLFDVLNR